MEESNQHELLRKCNLLNDRHQILKQEILERSMLNEKAIIELNEIEEDYKIIVEQLREVANELIK